MKAKDIRQLTLEEMRARLVDDEKTYSRMRFQLATSQLDDVTKVKQMRRDIARLKTVMRELENAGEQDS